MSKPRVFVSFDIDHDRELYERLREESDRAGFSVAGASERPSEGEVCSDRVRRRIRDADQVIVICGEHSGASSCMSAELQAAREEKTPYFLLWGRRERMCTKPHGAPSTEGIYGWTPQILHDQLAFVQRRARSDAAAESLRNPPRKA